MHVYKPEPSWRKGQAERIRRKSGKSGRKKPRRPGSFRIRPFPFLVLFFLAGFLFFFFPFSFREEQPGEKTEAVVEKPRTPDILTDRLIHRALKGVPQESLVKEIIPFHIHDQPFTAISTLDQGLQNRLMSYILRAEVAGRGMPELLSLVVMEPDTGKIKGLAGTRAHVQGGDPSVSFTIHPAASIFKIVAAAAAMEKHGLTPDSPLFFNGEMYTLYKKQMSQQRHRYTNQISLKDAFARSINPVFGKLGYHDLQKPGLSLYAERFGFDGRPPEGTLPAPASEIVFSDTPYSWAEIASGFNRRTLISPIHGASIASAIVADGILPSPHIIEKVMDADQRIRYQGSKDPGRQAIRKETAEAMQVLMERTITSGTSSRIFRGHQRDRILGSLRMGGKTGSISNRSRDIRYDWFVGYAIHPDGRRIVVSIMVGHGAYIGRRAGEYAKDIFSFWFDPGRIPVKQDEPSV
ncbi:penicillin binding protein [Desulfobotulus alkaliphilus]|uniref:Penicillin binding protein n=1 Tax=Desulfobotulus alkaliphilus TaxID=622671 RepID=A0A562S773_9BACT|nr:penicillin-binding transpeptidase domain-containing protein [Desulfobotulus alkaliphilus]TWI77269.1 penicillin binding protein [Desulfobotulus alkaliphilus]